MNRKILNFGSLNLDFVYHVDEFVKAGETKPVLQRESFIGGKGCNQTIALARAGTRVQHAGVIGRDGLHILDFLAANQVDTSFIRISETLPTGHAIIQVNPQGENCILVYAGANADLTPTDLEQTLSNFSAADILLIQNETNLIPELIQRAKQRDLTVVFNPAPISPAVLNYPLELVDILIVNETEGQKLANTLATDSIMDKLLAKFPQSEVILTLGKAGVEYGKAELRYYCPAIAVPTIDSTAAGDTFIGYYLSAMVKGISIPQALKEAALAAALSTTKAGATASIPWASEVQAYQLRDL